MHELIHLHYCLFEETEPETIENIMMERSINYIAEALVRLKRSAKSETIPARAGLKMEGLA